MEAEKASMFTDGEFKVIADSFRARRPDLVNDRTKMEEEILKFDVNVDKNFAALQGTKDESERNHYLAAINILLQGRNFLARLIGKAERPIPKIDEVEIDPIKDKHVAVWIEGAATVDSSVCQATAKFFGLSREPLRYRFYTDTRSIVADLSKLCGIISLSVGKKMSIESYLRHDRANRTITLPPCVDCDILQVAQAMAVILRLQNGEWVKESGAPFSLEDELPRLMSHMRIPTKTLMVTVADDRAGGIAGLFKILAAWPRLDVHQFTHDDFKTSRLAGLMSDIVLLDEDFSRWDKSITGTGIYQELYDHGLLVTPHGQRIVVSITSGAKPAFTHWHFPSKETIARSFDQALKFVQFMNKLIAEAEAK